MGDSIYDSATIFNCFFRLKLEQQFRRSVLKHMMSFLIAVFTIGYKGKVVQIEQVSNAHRTTIAYFLNHGKWDDNILERIIKNEVIRTIYGEAERTGLPVMCIVDDTINSKTKPSSRALHPMEDAYFHQSHLKKKQDYGHQAVSVMLSCNGITLNYAVVMYDKSCSKIQIACEIAKELPIPPTLSFFMCDCWYTCGKVIKAFGEQGFHTISAIKTNRIIFPAGVRQQIAQFADYISQSEPIVSLVTVGNRQYFIHRYEGKLTDLNDVVILISYPKDAFGLPQALRAFICTDTSLSTQEILDLYLERWSIEVFFREAKQKLAMDKYQIRSSKGIRRFWLLMSAAHLICCTGSEQLLPSHIGYHTIQKCIAIERVTYIYNCGAERVPLDIVLALAA